MLSLSCVRASFSRRAFVRYIILLWWRIVSKLSRIVCSFRMLLFCVIVVMIGRAVHSVNVFLSCGRAVVCSIVLYSATEV